MTPGSVFGYEQIVTEVIRGVIETVADRPGQVPERKVAAQQTVVCSVMAYNPRDPVETMMAGHCIVYDHMLRDGARDMLRGQADEIKIKARPGILATGKMFLSTMQMLARMQLRPDAQLAFARPLPVQEKVAETAADAPDDVSEEQPIAATPVDPRASEPAPPDPADVPPSPQSAGRPAGAHDVAACTALSPAALSPVWDRPAQGRTAPEPGHASPERPGAAGNPALHAVTDLLSREMVEEILFDGIDTVLKQEILAAAARSMEATI